MLDSRPFPNRSSPPEIRSDCRPCPITAPLTNVAKTSLGPRVCTLSTTRDCGANVTGMSRPVACASGWCTVGTLAGADRGDFAPVYDKSRSGVSLRKRHASNPAFSHAGCPK